MGLDIPFGVPAELIAGETWNWKEQFEAFPISDGWDGLTFQFRGVDVIDIPPGRITNDGSTWAILTEPNDTAGKLAGRYQWFARISASAGDYAGQTRTVKRGTVVIRLDPAGAVAGALQSENEKILALIIAETKARITGDGSGHDSIMVDGAQISKINFEQLEKLEQKYQARVNAERTRGRWGPGMAFRG